MPKSAVSPTQRKTTLDKRRRLKMAQSAHAYVRGNTVQFYEWLDSKAVRGSIPSGPDIWICGDCHTGNLGPIADSEGNIDIQIRDLDQTVIGNPAHDLLRLGLSLAMAARSSDLPGVTTALMMEELILGYISGLSGRFSTLDAKGLQPIRQVMRQANRRHWGHLAAERIDGVKPEIPLGSKFWTLTREETTQVEQLVASEDLQLLVRRTEHDDRVKRIRLLDAAYWMKGCSSLGRLRYALLIGVGKKKDMRYRLLDEIEATEPAGPYAKHAGMPRNNAERVVAGANALSPYLGERMAATQIVKRQVIVRELRPQDLKFELENLQQAEAIAIARLLAGVVGRAHGRQLSLATRRAWAADLKKRHSKGLDAPRWLWSGVLDLAALHEASYLEHCRQYALGNFSELAS